MSKFLSGRQSNLKLGVAGYTENKTVLETTGKVGIGTTDAQSYSLFVVGDTNVVGHTELDQLRVSGVSTFQSDIHFGDGDIINMGDNDDLKIYHHSNGTGVIQNAGSGQLQIRSNEIRLLNAATDEDYAFFRDDGAVELYYDDSKKFETTGIGVSIYNDLNVGTAVTIYGNAGIVSAISFYGDGANLTNTGATLAPAASTQRVVLTSLTSGTMVDAATDSDLTYNAATDTLNVDNLIVAGNLTVDGDQTILNVTQLEVEDINIGIASASTKLNNAQLDGAGITIHGSQGDKTLTWDNSNSRLGFNTDLYVPKVETGHAQITGGISTDGYDTGNQFELMRADGNGGWAWATVPGIFSVNNILNGFNVYEEGLVVGTAGSIHTLDFRGINVTASAAPQPNGIATVTFSTRPSFDETYITGLSTTGRLIVAGISTFNGEIDANGRIVAAATNNVIPFLYSNLGDLPSAVSFHGAFAHVHGTGKAYYAHAANWYELVNKETSGTVGTGTERYNIGPVDLTTLDVSGISTFAGLVDINGGGQANTFKVEDLTDNRVVIAGTGGELEDDANLTFDGSKFNVGSAITAYAATGIVSATAFYGDGSNLLNTGATLSAASGLQRLVVTDLTSGTMVDAATDGDLTFNASNNSLAVPNINVSVGATFGGTITAGSSEGVVGQYLRHVGTGVTWANFPTLRVVGINTAIAGQTAFNFTYNVDFLDVFVNGVKLSPSEYTATNGNQIVLNTPAFADEIVEFHSYNVASTYGGGGGGGGGSSNLSGLTDVTINTLGDGQLLQYNNASGQWRNVSAATVVGAASSFATKVSTATTATAGQTVFNGTYTVGFVDVYLNGSKLSEDQYTAASGTNIALDTGASEDDIIEVIGLTANVPGGGGGGGYGDSNVNAHLNLSTASTNEVLSWNGSDYDWVVNGSYANSDVDTHLNVSGASNNQILGWNGNDYVWVTNVSGASNLNALNDVTIGSLADNQLLQYNASNSKWENINLSSLGLITGVTASTGLSGGGSSGGVSLSLSSSGVTPGTYTNADITVDAYGRVTAAAIGTGGGSGVSIIRDDNTLVGSAGTINFGAGLDVSPVVSGMVTVTSNIVGDTTPQLGGDLYLNGNEIRNAGATVRIRDNGNVTAAGFAGNGGSITGIVTTNIINYGQGLVNSTVTDDLQSQVNALGNNLNIVGFYNALDGQITSYTVVGETRSYPTVGQPLPTVGITTGDYFIVGTGGTDVTQATFITSGISSAYPGDWVVGVGTNQWQVLSYSQQVVAPRASTSDRLQTSRDFSISGDVVASAVQFNGTANVGLNASLSNNFSANTSGTITAASFSGSGSNLTGLTGASAGTYGSASTVPQIAVDANGRITGISNVNVSGGGSSGISSVGIQSGGQLIGNATSLNFTGDAIETVTFSSGTATINTKASSSRSTGEITTASVNSGATVTGTVTLPKSGIILSASFVGISSGWLRLYSRADLATADANRTRFTDPLAGSGVLLETIKSGVGTVYLSPQTIFANVEDVVTNDYQYRYTNDGATGITTITFNYLSLEA